MKVHHIIIGLNNGGAEAVLFRLISASQDAVDHTVTSLLDYGIYGSRLQEMGVPVTALRVNSVMGFLLAVPRLFGSLKKQKPDVVQTWMYHADFIGGVIARLAGVKRVVWAIRHSNLSQDKFLTRLIAKGCSLLSPFIPAAITCNSENAAILHQKMGYKADKFRIIPNGYDIERFKPNSSSRRKVRAEWGVSDNETIIGLVGRWNPQKDHKNLLQALAELKMRGRYFQCVLVGPGITLANSDLITLVTELNLEDSVTLLGPQSDVPLIMNGLDLHVLSSLGEAFPNVVAEAMACGTPCVSTDVGDALYIVGNPAWIAAPGNSDALADAILNALNSIKELGREAIGIRCRQRIVGNFSLGRMVSEFQAVWSDIH